MLLIRFSWKKESIKIPRIKKKNITSPVNRINAIRYGKWTIGAKFPCDRKKSRLQVYANEHETKSHFRSETDRSVAQRLNAGVE